ncbi:MAG: hypothetical protein JXB23_00600, partial [Candidatus Aminicenantes bacterium]|nr:hypothetical protein [Candidatus Aminicenantes bacterium]
DHWITLNTRQIAPSILKESPDYCKEADCHYRFCNRAALGSDDLHKEPRIAHTNHNPFESHEESGWMFDRQGR